MIFSDLIFVFAFLPIYLTLSFCCRETWAKNAVSAAASIVFIAWGRSRLYALIVLPAFIIYILARLKNKVGRIVFEAVSDIFAAGFAGFCVVSLSRDNSLSSALISVGFLLFALRSVLYVREVAEGEPPERDLFALCAYLFSFENMLVAPVRGYSEMRKSLSGRKPTLAKMSAGLSEFIKGFALTAVCGLSFDRVRLAATEYEAFPWLNALALFGIIVCEAYVVSAGIKDMSSGLGLMNGFSSAEPISAFRPGLRLTDHVAGMWESFPKAVKSAFCGRSKAGTAVSLAALSLAAGAFIGFGAGAGAFVCIIAAAIVLEDFSTAKRPVYDFVFSAVMYIFAFAALIFGGAAGRFCIPSPSACDYDVTYALYDEFTRSLPWLIIGLLAISPLRRALNAFIRKRSDESESFYSAARIIETVLCAALLVFAAIASAA